MYQVIIVVHVLLGLGIIGLILMQQGKGADAGAAFGSGSSGSVFGAQGAASFLSRTTAILATSFFVTSLSLAVLSGKQGKAVDIMETTDIEKKVSDVPFSTTPTPVAVGSKDVPTTVAPVSTDAKSDSHNTAVNPIKEVETPVAVDSTNKVDENKHPDKAKSDTKDSASKKSEAKVKVIKNKSDKKETEKKHKSKSDKKVEKTPEKK
jgi:preprotein translocase subunit SecG